MPIFCANEQLQREKLQHPPLLPRWRGKCARHPALLKIPMSNSLLWQLVRNNVCLQASEIGTFLIRFSDSELGGVTVAWIACKDDIQPISSYILLKLSTRTARKTNFVFSKRGNKPKRSLYASTLYTKSKYCTKDRKIIKSMLLFMEKGKATPLREK